MAEALNATGVPLGLVPSGTGNLLARNLNLALDNLESSIRVAFTGADRPVDLGIMEIRRADHSTSRQLNLRYRLDESSAKTLHAHTIIIGNCGLLSANVLLLPDAAIDDGLFDVVLLRPTKAVRALRYLTGREITVRLDRAHDIELDGDSFGEAIALRAKISPGALIVRVPRTPN